jgi:predicted phosphoribosyltransferase
MFRDRRDAGRQLAPLLATELGARDRGAPVVIGLARGGLPVAAEVAERLGAPLDVMIVRKIGVPWQPELGVGALAEGGVRVLNDALIAEIGLRTEDIDGVVAREQRELERRVARYRGDRPPVDVTGRTAIVVDDGLATGYTAWAAIEALRARGAARVILAVPVAPPDTVAALARIADRVVAVAQPTDFMAIGEFYRDFSQESDEDVIAILAAHRPPAPA